MIIFVYQNARFYHVAKIILFKCIIFLFKVMPIVIFMSTAISILYYLEVIPFVIKHIGRFLGFCMGTRPAESLSAAGNIFLGMVGILLD